jgi:hypothetical protein
MALVSPGISISINDQSQYVNSNVGSVPLVVLATAQDKTYNGSPATGTTKANAGKLLSFSSQRDLVTQMGTPSFQISSSGTPVNGSEINEYGLLAAYSALGLSNQLYAIRADIDLNSLTGTSVRPLGMPMDGTYWLNIASTNWGISEFNSSNSTFTEQSPLLITDATLLDPTSGYPLTSVGQMGQYALVFVGTTGTSVNNIVLYYKTTTDSHTTSNTWVQVGSQDWQLAQVASQGGIKNPSITAGTKTITINGQHVITTATTVTGLASDINTVMNPYGVYAAVQSSGANSGRLQLFVDSSAASGSGRLQADDTGGDALLEAGIDGGHINIYCPILFYGSYQSVPSHLDGSGNVVIDGWYTTDNKPRSSGSVWWKTSAIGGGLSPVLKQYNSNLDQWESLSVPVYPDYATAIYNLDPTGGGINIAHGQVIAVYNKPDPANANDLRFAEQIASTETLCTGGQPTSVTISSSETLTILSTSPGTATLQQYQVVIGGTFATAQEYSTTFVSTLLSAGIPYVTAQVNTNGTISISHTTGGQVSIASSAGTGSLALPAAGFATGQGSGFLVNAITGTVFLSNWQLINTSIAFQSNAPYSAPDAGTLWYNSDAVDVDIMIQSGSGWKGYRNGGTDVRGFVLGSTDTMGVIVSANVAPQSQSNGNVCVPGDLWFDSGDLVNYPSLYRCTKVTNGIPTWTAIDNTDHVSQNGIIFADARWDGFADGTGGTTDIISGDMPSIQTLLTSDYIDLDAPDYRLYPRGTLLFNTRRSGYNVKKYVPNYFTSNNYPDANIVENGEVGHIPQVKDAWVTASGVDANEVMYSGPRAQRNMVVEAMQAAISSNLDVLSPMFRFNLICAPGYPELIPDMLTLNDNRGDTAFVIGDTPMNLAPNSTDIANWVNDTDGSVGYVIPSSPYLALYYPAGRTNDLAGNEVVVPASYAALRTYLYSDQVSYPWFAPAGYQRGLVNNLSDIGYINAETGSFVHNAISQGLRDTLFTLQINPITQFPATGIVVWGQLTRSAVTSARDRVNVVRLENYLRTIFQSIANGYLFEPNDSITRKSIASAISGSLNSVLAHRGLYDFLVICDSSNNTSATIANNQLYVDVAIEPERDVEFIYIPIAIYNPGQIASLG